MYWSCSIVPIVLRFIHRVELGFNHHTKSVIISHGKGFSMAIPFWLISGMEEVDVLLHLLYQLGFGKGEWRS